jgi:hypothetical protein
MKLKNLLKNKSYLQKVIFVGCLSLVVCLSGVLVAEATQNAGYGYGYSSQGYAYGYGYWTEETSTLAISYSASSVEAGDAITITATFGSAVAGTPDININLSGTANDTAYTAMTGSGTTWTYSYTAASITANEIAIVNVRTINGLGDTPTPSNNTFTITASSGGSGGGGGSATATSTTQTETAIPEAAIEGDVYEGERPAEPATDEVDEQAETEAETLYERITGEASDGSESSADIVNFIAYGTPSTMKLGSGERAGVVNSFRAAFGRVPTSDLDWQDIIKIANGRWPSQTNEAAEALASETFKTIYLREPNMDSPSDNAAVTVMAYGLRPADRNLDSERAAINIFRNIFKKSPESATEWDAVRAIAYSGATR